MNKKSQLGGYLHKSGKSTLQIFKLLKLIFTRSSPDLNPMYFGIWSILEQNACAKSHKNVDMLIRQLVKCWKQIDTKTFVNLFKGPK